LRALLALQNSAAAPVLRFAAAVPVRVSPDARTLMPAVDGNGPVRIME